MGGHIDINAFNALVALLVAVVMPMLTQYLKSIWRGKQDQANITKLVAVAITTALALAYSYSPRVAAILEVAAAAVVAVGYGHDVITKKAGKDHE